MKACVLPAPQAPLQIIDVPIPTPGPGQVLVRTEACGVCHSDVFLASSPKLPRIPLILGHEAVGRVARLGTPADDPSGLFQVGDRVGVAFLHHSCGDCVFCRSGRENYCLRQQQTGYHVDGALAEYVVADERFIARVPESMPAIQAAPLCCAGLTAYKAVRTAALAPGDWIALFGAGGLGHLGVQIAKQSGLQVAVIDIADDKLEMARQLGADVTINGSRDDPRAVLAAHAPDGIAGAITFTGSLAAVEQALPCLRPNGILVLVGLCTKRYELPVLRMVMQGLRVSGILVGTPRDLQEIIDLAASGTPHVHAEACRLEDVPEVMERMRQGTVAGRMVVKF